MAPEAPNVVETVRFLRRFADLMSNGQNSAWLLNAAAMLETLSGRISASNGEEQLWRQKCENLARDNDRLEAECDALQGDIDGHLELARTLLEERETLSSALQARETELAELNEALAGEREQLAAASQAHEQSVAEVRSAFDDERAALTAVMAVRDEELGRLREASQAEREQSAQQLQAREVELAELRLAFESEREELQSRIASSEALIAVLRSDAERDGEWMKTRIATLEAQRLELRSALDRLSDLQTSAAAPDQAAPSHSIAAGHPVSDEDSAVVPTATLRHARAQFEYLARESLRRGDVATQVMCELSAHTLELALKEAERADYSPAGRIALSILEP
jgi:chromosome segregation ATPase